MAGKGSNSIKLRHYNERFILDTIRRDKEASKSDLAKAASLTPAAISTIVDGLEASGFIKQVGKRFGKRGSPSIIYAINPSRLYSIGVKIGRRAIQTCLVNLVGDVEGMEEHEYDYPDPSIVQSAGNESLTKFIAQVDKMAGVDLAGVGIGAPFYLGGWSDELNFPSDLDSRWASIDLQNFFSIRENISVFVENDASAAALAELDYGAGGLYKDFMHISIDTFIGGGLVQNGTLHTGPHGNSAALGPLPVSLSKLNSRVSPQKSYSSLLQRASIYILVEHLRFHGVAVNRIRDLEYLSPHAYQPLQEWMEDCANALAEAIIAITSIIDIEAILIDSILPRTIHFELLSKIQRSLYQSDTLGIVLPEINPGRFGAMACAIGASTLPLSALIAPMSDTLMLGKNKKNLSRTLAKLS